MSCSLRLWADVALLLLLCLPARSHAWWNEDWAYRKKITLNTSASGADTKEAVTDLAVLVRLHTGNFAFLDAKDDGGDGSAVATDPKDPSVVYAASQFGAASRLNLKTGEKERIRPRAELSAKKKERPLIVYCNDFQ
jgi:hypothetical protein